MSVTEAETVSDLIQQMITSMCGEQKPETIRRLMRFSLGVLSSTQGVETFHDDEISVINHMKSKLNTRENIYFDKLLNDLKENPLKNRVGILVFLLHMSASTERERFSLHDMRLGLTSPIASTSLQTPSSSQAQIVALNTPDTSAQSTPISTSRIFNDDCISEEVLVQELIYSFQGIEGRLLKLDTSYGFQIDQKAKLNRYHHQAVLRLSELGYLHNVVRRGLERLSPKGAGRVSDSLVAVLHKELSEYYRLIAMMQEEVNRAHGSMGFEPVTLSHLHLWAYDPLESLKWLASIVRACATLKGGALASAVYEFSNHGDPRVQKLVRRILESVCEPLYNMLIRWITDGVLDDPFQEFFIEARANVNGDRMWHEKYLVRDSMVPSFISKSQAKKILGTGKSINFLREVCKDSTPLRGRDRDLFGDDGRCNVEAFFDMDPDGPLQTMMEAAYNETSTRVVEILMKEYQLMDHLQGIKGYLLLGQGHFIQHLMHLLEGLLAKPANSLYPHNISSVLETAIRATCTKIEDIDVQRRLDIRMLPPSENETGWDVFMLDYNVDGPIGTNWWTKEGFLMKQTWSFQRWRRRYFKLKDRTLYYAKDAKDTIFDEIELTDLTLAECSTKNFNHSFQVITPFRSLVLCGETRQDMEEWLSALRTAGEGRAQGESGAAEFLGGNHHWYATSHARPTYCNVCRDALYGVTSHGLSCEVCKYKVHKRCSPKAINNCKWTTLSSIGKDIIEDHDGNIQMPHQWLEGNLPVSSKCSVCDKTCGSVLRLQDWKCLWCRTTVHTACRPSINPECPLGPSKLSVVPPTALHSIGSDEAWEAVRPNGCSPLLVFVNSKSGDNQGIKFLRRFKQLLNPAQVFDLIKGGPGPGLRLFRHFDPFRILVCSGDGSVGWVLSEIDRLGMHKQCQVGVLPLGTGNDLARVLGWGASCDDDTHLPQLLEKYEKAGTKMLDRWSIMTFQRSISLPCHKLSPSQPESTLSVSMVHQYEDNVISNLKNILQSDQDTIIISSAKVLHETVKDLATKVLEASLYLGDQVLVEKCQTLEHKVDQLLQTMNNENLSLNNDEEADQKVLEPEAYQQTGEFEKGSLEKPEKEITNLKRVMKNRNFMERDVIISRANSLKRAIRQLVEHAEVLIEEQKNGSMRSSTKTPNITVNTDDNSPTNRKEQDFLNFKLTHSDTNPFLSPTPVSSGSSDVSPCASPMPNLASLSPMPDLRRDSQAEEILTLPAPDGFADSRRNSSNMPHGTFSFSTPADSVSIKCAMQAVVEQQSEQTQLDTQTDIQVSVTSTTLDTTSRSDDTTIQDAMISPDSDSPNSTNMSLVHRTDHATKTENSRSSGSNSIVSSDSIVSDTLDSKSMTVKHSESEIGHIDSDILDSTKYSESHDIGHIDSPEISELQNSESIIDDLSSLGQDLMSTMLGEKYDSVRECIETDAEKPKKYCSLAQFGEGSDIARRSFKKPCGYISSLTKKGQKDSEQSLDGRIDLLSPVCCFKVTSEPVRNEKSPQNFPPAISVIVDPPSPSMSIESHGENHQSKLRRHSRCSMERLSVELPELGFSPQATRRISSGSLLKASEVVSLAATASRFGGSSMSLRHDRAKSVDKSEEVKKLPIINPLVRLPMWPNVSGGAGLISQALLANADALCAAVSPLMDPDETLMEGYFERCVMNNYFGIGIDAKISLDFHQKREEHPEKCRSRAKNYMWYGVLGSKQWLQKTYKNLEQRVQLECDGQRIPLPSLQGIVVLNIPSFMGGTNFWGGTKEGDLFLAPSFDDRVLEVVAVFGSVQMAASRLINLQHHRIAQCQTVQINILGDEGVPIQVDGEAWIQPPGIIRIIHKNRMQMLYRNRALETSLRAWEEKQRSNTSTTVSQSTSTISNRFVPMSANSRSENKPVQFFGIDDNSHIEMKPIQLYEEELNILLGFIEVVTTLVKWVKLLTISHPSLEPELYQIADRTAHSLEKVHPDGKILEGSSLRPVVTELVSNSRQLYEESCELLRDKAHNLRLREDLENKLSQSLATMEHELRKCVFDEALTGMVYLQNIPTDDQGDKKNRHRGLFWLKFRRPGGNSGNHPARDQVTAWGVQDVCVWLENLQLGEYTEQFISHDIRGRELLTLARRDLKELGIVKVGHVKRILQAINDLNN